MQTTGLKHFKKLAGAAGLAALVSGSAYGYDAAPSLKDESEDISFELELTFEVTWNYEGFSPEQLELMGDAGFADAKDTWVYTANVIGQWEFNSDCTDEPCPRVFAGSTPDAATAEIVSSSPVPVGSLLFPEYSGGYSYIDTFLAFDNLTPENAPEGFENGESAPEGVRLVIGDVATDCVAQGVEDIILNCRDTGVDVVRRLDSPMIPDFSRFDNLTDVLESFSIPGEVYTVREVVRTRTKETDERLYAHTKLGTAIITAVNIKSWPQEEIVAEKPATCKFVLAAEWDNGFTGFVHMKNETTETLDGWNLNVTFPVDVDINSAWSSEFSGTSPSYTASNLSWNKLVYPGQEINFGFVGSKTPGESVSQTKVTGDICR